MSHSTQVFDLQAHRSPSDEPIDPVEAQDELRDKEPRNVEEELVELAGTPDEVVTLDDLLDAPLSQQTGPGIQTPIVSGRQVDDGLSELEAAGDDLDNLLEESVMLADQARLIKAARKQAFDTRGELTPEAREKLRQQILKWELEVEYHTVAVVTVFEWQNCACGAKTLRFYGLFVKEVKRDNPNLKRFVRWFPQEIDVAIKDLPREWTTIEQAVPFCPVCHIREGFISETQVDWTKVQPAMEPVRGTRRTLTMPSPKTWETVPHGGPVQAKAPGTLTEAEEAEEGELISKSLAHAAYPQSRPSLTVEDNKRMAELSEKRNLGRIDLPLRGNT